MLCAKARRRLWNTKELELELMVSCNGREGRAEDGSEAMQRTGSRERPMREAEAIGGGSHERNERGMTH